MDGKAIMKNHISQNGFTLIEILVAVFIMSVGFLALSQMEFLSLRQKQMAEAGSNATNIIQAAADRDLAEIKRVALLNNQTFFAVKDGRTADFTYCDGSKDYSICSNCPCNPLASITPDFTIVASGPTIKDIECAAIALDSSDIKKFTYTTDQTTCKDFYDNLGVGSLGADGKIRCDTG